MTEKPVTKQITIEAKTEEQLHMFESFINYIDRCSRRGMSKELVVFVDGGGDTELLFEPTDELTCPFTEFNMGNGHIKFKDNEPYYWDLR